MYIILNGEAVKVSVVSGKVSLSTLTFYEQDDIQTVIGGLGTEIRLYEDTDLMVLAAVYNQVEIEKAAVDLKKHTVSVTISASRLTDLETEKLKEDIAAEQSAGGDRDEALTELAGMLADMMDAVTEISDMVADLEVRVKALEEKEEEVVENG